MKISILTLFAGAVLLAPATLRADTYVTYTLSAGDTLAGDGGSIAGTFTVDVTTLHVTGTIVADGMTYTANNAAMSCPNGNCANEGFVASGSGGGFVFLTWPTNPAFPSLLNLDSLDSYCAGCVAGKLDYISATDTAGDPPNSMPEPATALMLLAGLAGVPFMRRRRAKE